VVRVNRTSVVANVLPLACDKDFYVVEFTIQTIGTGRSSETVESEREQVR
jgi:hypothetical protein